MSEPNRDERQGVTDRATADLTPPGGPTVPAVGPRIRVLEPAECLQVLDRNFVGRIAYAFDRRIEILPVHYVHDDGWLYGRTSPSDKLAMWQHSRWVAFEVDEVRALFDWTSVVVHGGLYLLAPDAAHEAAAWEHAVDVLRRLLPGTATTHDPVPFRSQVFRIHVDEMTGRQATPPPGPS